MQGTDINPSCFTVLEWIKCVYRLPPCIDNKLILPCPTACGIILEFFIHCYTPIEDVLFDQNVRDHFRHFRCRVPESYYAGYKPDHFIVDNTHCFGPTSTITSVITPTSTVTNVVAPTSTITSVTVPTSTVTG